MTTVKYLGTDENTLSLEALNNIYWLIASTQNKLKRRDTKAPVLDRKLSEADSVLFKDNTTGLWDPRYTRDY